MRKHLFLQAPVQAGKSTLLQDALNPYKEYIGGFVSQRLKDKDGNTLGFRLADYAASPELTAVFNDKLTNIFMKKTSAGSSFEMSVFEGIAIDILEKARKEKKIILLDEIGGGELKSPTFSSYLNILLKGNIPCIGVLKMSYAAAHTGHSIGLNLQDKSSEIHDMMSDYKAEILPYKRESYEIQKKYIQDFVEEKLCGNYMTD